MTFTGRVTPVPSRFLTAVASAFVLLLAGCAVPGGGVSPVASASAAAASPAGSGAEPPSPAGGPGGSVAPTPSAPPPTAVDCRKAKCVALTFDDGPGPQTGRLLDTLVRERVPATFFLVGAMIRQHPDVAKRIASTPGMTVANHTLSHPMLTRIPAATARKEIVGNTALIAKVTGVHPHYLRPPYGLHNAATDAVARSQGQAVVLWSAGALDWQYDKPAKIIEVTLPQIRPGAIVLAHDIHPWTIKAVPTLIAKLRAKGYTLVSLEDILGPTKPGRAYARGRH